MKSKNSPLTFIFVVAFAGAILITIFIKNYLVPLFGPGKIFPPEFFPPKTTNLSKVEKFKSEAEFKEYLEKSPAGISGLGSDLMFGNQTRVMLEEKAFPSAAPEGMGAGGAARVSETNVQVAGIDEPDIVKTDGKEIYFSSPQSWVEEPIYRIPEIPELRPDEKMIYPSPVPPLPSGGLSLVRAFPPADLAKDSELNLYGDLLLKDKILLVFSQDYPKKIYGYDVADPKKPEKKWEVKIAENHELVTSRLYDDRVYLVVRSSISPDRPCPIKPLNIEGEDFSIGCADIYHPITPIPTDVTYSFMRLNPNTGRVEKTATFVASSDSATVYMSENFLYLGYLSPGDMIDFFVGLLTENGDLFPASMVAKIKKLQGYDLSANAKMAELGSIMEKYQNSLASDERLKVENELQNRFKSYLKKHGRELLKTGIVKVAVDDLQVAGGGEVPGSLLNQFSLDEYEGNLRVATTTGGGFWGWGFGGDQGESVSDVYVLDKNLRTIGAVQDLGKGERIYSARFVEDKGYLVTFRQTDPFYVLDLSRPRSPELKGELKIPGFSSYLHPITQDLVLGIGEEGNQVKVSLFDVSRPADPKEVAKYNLDEYWSEVANTHHAFLLDKKHSVFFLPGSKGGYVFSYQNDNLKLVKAVSSPSARRALYLNDYLYIISDQKITVLNEKDWEKVNELDL